MKQDSCGLRKRGKRHEGPKSINESPDVYIGLIVIARVLSMKFLRGVPKRDIKMDICLSNRGPQKIATSVAV